MSANAEQLAEFARAPQIYELAAAWRLLAPRVRLRPALGLDFPPGEIIAAAQEADGWWTLTVGLPGLYGNGSPLPLAYTDEVLAEGDDSLRRGVIDLLNDRLLQLEAEAITAGEVAADQRRRLALLLGLDQRVIADDVQGDNLLRYANLFAGRSRTAAGLASLLSHWSNLPCTVESCIALWTPIAEEERSRLGHAQLGIDAVAGAELCSRATSFGITVGPLPWSAAQRWLPGGARLATLCALTDLVNRDALAYEVRVLIDHHDMPCVGIGSSHLGLDTRLAGQASGTRNEVVYRSGR